MEKVIETAKKACCHDFIMALPDGYETVIGDGGASLSGGEKQRISVDKRKDYLYDCPRLKTVRNADRMLVLDHGKIVQQCKRNM